MPTYTLSDEATNDLRRNFWRGQAITAALTAITLGYVLWSFYRGESINIVQLIVPVLLVIGFAIFMGLRVRRSFLRQTANLQAYKLDLEGDALTRHGGGLPVLTIERGDVTEIAERPGQGLSIYSETLDKSIFVPALIGGYDDVRSVLAGWGSIKVMEKPEQRRPSTAMVGITLALLYFAALIAPNNWVGAAVGILMIVIGVGVVFLIWRNPNVAQPRKWASLALLFVLVPIVSKVALSVQAVMGG